MLAPHIQEKVDGFYTFLASLWLDKGQLSDENMICIAFVHKSYASDFTGNFEHNERLEFLGDAVLSAIVAKMLYQQYPTHAESDLTLYKIALVRAENLAAVAQDIGLDKVILLGNGEEKNNGRAKTTILCDCLEAILGYVYLDCGIDAVEKLIEKYIFGKLAAHTDMSVKSYKSHLQEHIQKIHKITPTYVEKEIGKDPETHDILYQSDLYMGDQHLGTGTGTNKKKAQEQAAKQAFEKLTS